MIPHLPLSAWIGLAICALAGTAAAAWFLFGQRERKVTHYIVAGGAVSFSPPPGVWTPDELQAFYDEFRAAKSLEGVTLPCVRFGEIPFVIAPSRHPIEIG